jgi:hypothetical protein
MRDCLSAMISLVLTTSVGVLGVRYYDAIVEKNIGIFYIRILTYLD